MVLDSIYPSTGGGGAESQVGTLGQWLARQGIPCTIVVPMVPYGPQIAHERHGLVEIVRLRYPVLPAVGGLVLLSRLAALLLRRRHEIQAIHCHIARNMAMTATLLNLGLRKPLLTKLTGMTEVVGGILDPDASLPNRLRRRIFRLGRVQAISHAIARRLREAGFAPDRILEIPNGVDLERFAPAPLDGTGEQPAGAAQTVGRTPAAGNTPTGAAAAQEAPLTFLFVGRLEAVKGIDLLIDAWVQAFAADAPVRLLLVGAGSLHDSLATRVGQLRREHQIRFLGRQDDVVRLMAQADLGVLPSHTEGLSNTLLESMAMGLPMIGSRISGNEDFIQPDVTGWLFPPGDTAALADCLRAAYRLERGQLATLGENARQEIIRRASIPVVGSRLLAAYGLAAPVSDPGVTGHDDTHRPEMPPPQPTP